MDNPSQQFDDIELRPLMSEGANVQEVLIVPEAGEAKLYRRVPGGWVEIMDKLVEEDGGYLAEEEGGADG